MYIPKPVTPTFEFTVGAKVRWKSGNDIFEGNIEKEYKYCVRCRTPEGLAFCPSKNNFVCGDAKLA